VQNLGGISYKNKELNRENYLKQKLGKKWEDCCLCLIGIEQGMINVNCREWTLRLDFGGNCLNNKASEVLEHIALRGLQNPHQGRISRTG